MDKKIERINKLIQRISRGDISALDGLFEETGGLLLRMAKKYLFDKSLAEDLVSEIFARLVKRSRSFDVRRNGLNWLYKSVRNEAFDRNKKSNPNLCENIDDRTDLQAVLPSEEGNINNIMLYEALKTLSVMENKILYHKFWEGLTVREIAKLTKKPRSTVQDIIEKALAKIGKIIK